MSPEVASAVCEGVQTELLGRKLEAAGSVVAAFTGALRSAAERLLT